MKQALRLLIIEDNEDDTLLLTNIIKRVYRVQATRVETESAFCDALKKGPWDCILADYTLPAFGAPHALALLQDMNLDIPFIVVTGTIGEEDAVRLMDQGAHDYILKGNLFRLVPAITRERRDARVRRDHKLSVTALLAAHEALIYAYDATLEGWVHALDLRDKETEGHTQRVTRMTVRLARGMGISNGELEQIRRGALLHDIGKLGIPDRILLKEGPLDEKEWAIMKLHPVYAAEWINPIAYLAEARAIPANHHEKWDGTGYPRGLIGTAIPLSARIFSVIDAYDALTSDRPYRAAWSSERAVQEIVSESGKAFDPDVVAAFVLGIQSGAITG